MNDDFANVSALAQLLHKINTSQVRKVSPPYDHRQLSYIARFVNSACTWQKGILEDAFEYLETFFKGKQLREPHNLLNFRLGPQTPEYPKSLNACVLYGMSRAFKLPTEFTTTIDEMAYKLSVLGKLITDPGIKHSIKQTIYNLLLTDEFDEAELVTVLTSSAKGKRKLHELGNTTYTESIRLIEQQQQQQQPQPAPTYVKPKYEYNLVELNYDTLEEIFTRLPVNVNDRRAPTTQLEAIAMAAKYFYYDISDTSNPLAEYHALTQIPHFPYDRQFSKLIYEAYHNPEIFDNPRLDQNFNPYFRIGMYTNETLRNLCKREGIPEARWRDDNPYTLLQSAHVMSTFSHGIHFGISNAHNSYMTPLDELNSNEVVCYGVRTRIKDRSKGLDELTFYTYEELAGSFRTHRKFLDPLTTTNSVFPSTAIEKLVYLAGLPRRPVETEEMYRKRVTLKETIERVNICSSINVDIIKEFVRQYDISMENQQQYIRLLLTDILHIAMYMRSWNGPPDHYPLRAEDTRVIDQGEVDVRVGAAIRIYAIHCIENPVLGDMISGLPLMTKDDAHNIKVCAADAEGLTIKGRIDIVMAANPNANVNSCIRITSNRLAASAYYYMQIINMDTPFDITMLAPIQ